MDLSIEDLFGHLEEALSADEGGGFLLDVRYHTQYGFLKLFLIHFDVVLNFGIIRVIVLDYLFKILR